MLKQNELLKFLNSKGIKVYLDGGRLKTQAEVGVITEELAATIKKNKEELVAFLEENPHAGESVGVALSPRGIEKADALELSSSQQRLWIIDQMSAGQNQYNVAAVLKLTGDIDKDALESAVETIVERHEVLRTSIVSASGNPAPVVRAPWSPIIEQLSPSIGVRFDETDDLVRTFCGRPFDLANDALVHVGLVALGEREHLVMLAMHHIVSDAWSMRIMIRELETLYNAFSRGEDNPLPPLPIQYSDFAYWQNRMLSTDRLQTSLDYWLGRLEGAPELHSLPLDNARPVLPDHVGGAHVVSLDSTLVLELNRIARENGSTLFMLLETCLAVLIARWSHSDDIVVGCPVSGRSRKEVEDLIGFFVNSVIVRTRVDMNAEFRDLLSENRTAILEAFSHKDVPFDVLVDKLSVTRSRSHTPVFQIMFDYERASEHPICLGELAAEPVGVPHTAAKFDLEVKATEIAGEVRLAWGYAASLFSAETVSRMANAFERILQAVVRNSAVTLREIPLTDDEDKKFIAELGRGGCSTVPDLCIHELFESQVAKSPDAIAVIFGGSQLTYGELNARANQLAHQLVARGVKPDDIVGLCVERSLEMVIAVLGILKAGCAYLPLEPSYPEARLVHMTSDSEISLVVTTRALLGLEFMESCERVLVDDIPAQADCSRENIPSSRLGLKPWHLSYVIYTSGSTGKPKGVEICHQNTVAMLSWAAHEFTEEDRARVLAGTSLNFDLSVFELFLPLCFGQTCVVVESVLSLLSESVDVTLVNTVPSAIKVLMEQGAVPKQARVINLAGEPLTAKIINGLLAATNCRKVYNLYGPTEDTTYTTYAQFSEPVEGVPSIGWAITNTELFVLSEAGDLLPVGAVGELYIGGAGLARGYLNRPDLTRDKFIENPFSSSPGARLYKTGDWVRWQPDGRLSYLGRIDDQVKLRGFRIELGEIQAHLLRTPGVGEAIVIAQGDEEQKRLIAYLVLDELGQDDSIISRVKADLANSLADHMRPSAYVILDSLPLTANGKVDRKALPAYEFSRPSTSDHELPRYALEAQLVQIWSDILKVDSVGVHDNFFEVGGNSLLGISVREQIKEQLEIEIAVTDLFEFPTIAKLAEHLQPEAGSPRESADSGTGRTVAKDIAIIGMSGRFPGADDIDSLWTNIRDGVETIRFFDKTSLLEAGVSEELIDHPEFVPAAALLNNVELFDAEYFGFTPREAEITDPQQRLLLECASEALDQAGYGDATSARDVSVFVGVGESSYLLRHLFPNRELLQTMGLAVAHANSGSYTATRLSYKLNLSGASVSIATACSTSLVAVHQACNSIRLGECRMALAGGAGISQFGPDGYVYQEGGIESPDGHCRAFDKDAKGTRSGNGVGVVLLKSLEAALEDGDTIYAVVKGSAVNNDGAEKVGYTAPSISGQVEVIRGAHVMAGVSPDSIQYVETHGTGTPLGDPIEVKALTRAFAGTPEASCALGTLKPNIGHLDTAAGIAGLIKTVEALRRREVPPAINFLDPNSEIDFANSPFYVNTRLKAWDVPVGMVRRAGVSSFGIGGTNAHVVLEEAPEPVVTPVENEGPQLLVLSAKTASALELAMGHLADHLTAHPEQALSNTAYTLQVGRTPHGYRGYVVADSREDAASQLRDFIAAGYNRAPATSGAPIVFLFPGQGAQYENMAKGLYRSSPVFREHFDRCAELVARFAGVDIHSVVYPDEKASSEASLQATALTQPALFTIEYSLATLLMSCGVRPDAMLGHSLGEYVAACVAGVFTLEDGVRLVCARAELMQRAESGKMISLALSEEAAESVLSGTGCCIAAVNGPKNCVAAGSEAEIARLRQRLDEQDLVYREIATSHAFHSHLMDSLLEPFREVLTSIQYRQAAIPILSNVSGNFARAEELRDPEYWLSHLRNPVLFHQGVNTLTETMNKRAESMVFIEVGPGNTLVTLVRKHKAVAAKAAFVTTVRHAKQDADDFAEFLRALGALWSLGVECDGEAVRDDSPKRRIPLPTYPFERKRFWIARDQRDTVSDNPAAKHGQTKDWFYRPIWTLGGSARVGAVSSETSDTHYLIVADTGGVAASAEQLLRQTGAGVSLLARGKDFSETADGYFTADLGNPQQLAKVFQAIEAAVPSRLHLVYLTGHPARGADASLYDAILELVQVGKILSAGGFPGAIRADVVTKNAVRVTGEERLNPFAAPVAAFGRVLGQEIPDIECRHVDLDLPDDAPNEVTERAGQLLAAEVVREKREQVVALRGRMRWVGGYQPLEIQEERDSRNFPARLRKNGVYLITGGLGNIGLTLAELLVKEVGARVVLVGRSGLPARGTWPEWLSGHDLTDEISQKIAKIQQLESDGGEVLVCRGDVADSDQMQSVFEEAETRFGNIHGVIHASGIVKESMVAIADIDRRVLDSHYLAKARGTDVLDELLRTRDVDFCVLMSSLSAVLGGLGFGAYAAANAYLDAFAQYKHSVDDARWLSVNWDGWNFEGARGKLNPAMKFAMDPQEGAQAFLHALTTEDPQLVNSTGELRSRIQKWIDKAPAKAATEKNFRPDVGTAYVAPSTAIEEAFVEIWQELLGIHRIGVHDNFFELGGDSLLATQVIAKLRSTLGVSGETFTIKTFFEEPYIKPLATKISSALLQQKLGDQRSVLQQSREAVEEGEF